MVVQIHLQALLQVKNTMRKDNVPANLDSKAPDLFAPIHILIRAHKFPVRAYKKINKQCSALAAMINQVSRLTPCHQIFLME